MEQDCHSNIRLDANGNPDAQYYVDMAHQMRAEVMHGWFSALFSWVGSKLVSEPKPKAPTGTKTLTPSM